MNLFSKTIFFLLLPVLCAIVGMGALFQSFARKDAEQSSVVRLTGIAELTGEMMKGHVDRLDQLLAETLEQKLLQDLLKVRALNSPLETNQARERLEEVL